jgi:hypothetical protein
MTDAIDSIGGQTQLSVGGFFVQSQLGDLPGGQLIVTPLQEHVLETSVSPSRTSRIYWDGLAGSVGMKETTCPFGKVVVCVTFLFAIVNLLLSLFRWSRTFYTRPLFWKQRFFSTVERKKREFWQLAPGD